MMKILFLSAGNSVHTIKWVNALEERGHDISLVYNKGHEPVKERLNDNIKCYCLKYSGNAGYYLNAGQLKKFVKEIQPDVINAHYASGYGTLARVSKIGPVLLSVWGSDVYDFPYESKIKNRIFKKNINYAAMLASTSECMAKQMRKVMGTPQLDISITPFGVDLRLFDPDIYKKSKSVQNIIIGNIKSLEPIYGIDKLLYAVDILLKRLNNVGGGDINIKLKIYGTGSQKEELQKLATSLNLNEVVCFEGRIANTEVPKALAEMDIFCVTSRKESFGVAVVEAMAMGLPVVATNAEGFREVMEDGKTGVIIDEYDAEQIADALERLVSDETLRQNYGENGRRRAVELYDWNKNVDTMEAVYETMKKAVEDVRV